MSDAVERQALGRPERGEPWEASVLVSATFGVTGRGSAATELADVFDRTSKTLQEVACSDYEGVSDAGKAYRSG